MEAGGKVLVEEKDSLTTVLAASRKTLEKQRDLARRFVAAHRELTEWIRAHPQEAQALVRQELADETHTDVKPELVAHAWGRIILTTEVPRSTLESFVQKSKQAGFLRRAPDLSGIIESP
jgi:NitT/TauT family transport system substrate-binding protein